MTCRLHKPTYHFSCRFEEVQKGKVVTELTTDMIRATSLDQTVSILNGKTPCSHFPSPGHVSSSSLHFPLPGVFSHNFSSRGKLMMCDFCHRDIFPGAAVFFADGMLPSPAGLACARYPKVRSYLQGNVWQHKALQF